MQRSNKFMQATIQLLSAGGASLLLLAVACGAGATATPKPPDTPQPAATVLQPKDVGPTPALTLAPTATAVAAPAPTPAPVVHPGKLTWMVPSWGNGRFDYMLSVGSVGNNCIRFLHGFVIATNERAELLPGIAN